MTSSNKATITALAVISILSFWNTSFAEVGKNKSFLLPDLVSFQTAGYVGYISVFPAYLFFDSKLELAFGYGYVPEEIGGREIHTLAFRTSYFPFRINVKDILTVNPIYFGFTALWATDENLYWEKSTQCPEDYYSPTGFHVALNAGMQFIFNGTRPKHGFFIEITALDTYLKAYYKNDDKYLLDNGAFFTDEHEGIHLKDCASLAMGYKLFF